MFERIFLRKVYTTVYNLRCTLERNASESSERIAGSGEGGQDARTARAQRVTVLAPLRLGDRRTVGAPQLSGKFAGAPAGDTDTS